MACDASIIPAVLGARSEVLDLGRTEPARHAEAAAGAVPARPRLHLPGLFAAPVVVRRPPRPALVRRRPDRPEQHGPVVPAAPHDRAPEGLHRHRRRVRGDLAPVAAPPRDPPHPAGRTGTPRRPSWEKLRPSQGEARVPGGSGAGLGGKRRSSQGEATPINGERRSLAGRSPAAPGPTARPSRPGRVGGPRSGPHRGP